MQNKGYVNVSLVDFLLKTQRGDMVVAGEVKPGTYAERKPCLAKQWDREKYIPENDGTKWVSPIKQVYNYMLVNGMYYGMLATHANFWFFIRDCAGNLGIVDGFQYNTITSRRNPLSVVQAIVLFANLAHSKMLPNEMVGNRGPFKQCSRTCRHTTEYLSKLRIGSELFPVEIAYVQQSRANGGGRVYRPNNPVPSNSKRRKQSGKPKSRMYRYYDSDFSTRVIKYLPGGRTGTVRHLKFGAMGPQEELITKSADIVKRPELEKELNQEAAVYERLSSIQGKYIPEFLGVGEDNVHGFWYNLSTSYEGVDAEELPFLTEYEIAAALEALANIHKLGVLHGDLRVANVVVNREVSPPKVKIIDFGCAEIVGNSNDGKISERMLYEQKHLENILSEKMKSKGVMREMFIKMKSIVTK
jgi:hypothetical protein